MKQREKKIKLPKPVNKADGINLINKRDRWTALLFVIIFAASLAAYWYLLTYQDFTVYTALPVMSAPFFVIGVIDYILRERYFAMIFILALSVIAYFLLPSSVLFLVYLLVCTEGVVQLVESIQRWMFYKVLGSIERVNVKEKMNFMDRLIVFAFNVPVDLDTRNLTIDTDITRNKLPWRDMVNTMLLALLFCMFLWVYLFLNPSFDIGAEGVPIYTFTIVLYLSVIVMPWSIFNTLNARICTEYRDFKLYNGFLETFKRMFLPMAAALIFLIIAVSSGPENLYYVGMSLLMIIVMIVFTSVMYYTDNETRVIKDILDKWDQFQPTSIYSGYSESGRKSSLDDGVPGTPRRNPSDCFIPDIRSHSR